MTDQHDDVDYDVRPLTAVRMYACPYYQGIGSCGGGCYEEPACHVDEPEGGWEAFLPADFDLDAHRESVAAEAERVAVERWLAAEKRWLERPVLEEMTCTGVYPINPASPMYAKGTRFAAFHAHDGGTATSWHETEAEARAQLEEHDRLHDRFWSEKQKWMEHGDRTINDHYGTRKPTVSSFRDVLRVNGQHYTVAYEGIRTDRSRDVLGFGGAVFRWRWLDEPEDVVHESNCLWTQGRIPDDFRDRLPDNAVFLPAGPKR